MEKQTNLLLWLFMYILCESRHFGHCFFDVDEINSVNYGIDILDVPVMQGQDHSGGSVFLASRYGQQYQCTYREKSHEAELKEKEEEKVAMETGIVELLKPMENGPCLINTKGWWTYEFCYGKYIKQFHLEDAKITGTTMYLGHYHNDYDWSNTTQLRKQRSWLSRYHTQQYVNGTSCDLTGKSRRTEVRFYCEQTQSDYISRVDETETCVYTISVQTARICNHPYLKPPTPTKAIPITCNPVLSEPEYNRYLDMIAAEEEKKLMKQRYIEAEKELTGGDMESLIRSSNKEALSKRDSDLQDESAVSYDLDLESPAPVAAADGDTAAAEDADEAAVDGSQLGGIQKILSETLIKELKDVLGEQNENSIKISKMKVKKIKSTDNIDEIIKDALKTDKKGKHTAQITDEGQSQRSRSLDDSVGKEEEEEEKFDTQGQRLEDEDEDLSKQEDFSEEDEDGGEQKLDEDEDDDENALLEFDKGLDDIVETEGHLKQIKDYKDTLQQEINAQFDDILKEAEEELDMDLKDVENIDTDQAIKTMSETLQKLMKQLEKKTMKKSSSQTTDTLSSSEYGEDEQLEEQPQAEGVEGKSSPGTSTDTNIATKTDKDSDEDGLMNMEYDLNYGEHKIQVKIFTSSDYNYEEATADMLQGGNAINKMIVAVLGGNSDEMKEAQRQEKMENGYSFKWDSGHGANTETDNDGSSTDTQTTDNS